MFAVLLIARITMLAPLISVLVAVHWTGADPHRRVPPAVELRCHCRALGVVRAAHQYHCDESPHEQA